jgi:hypothetical protein
MTTDTTDTTANPQPGLPPPRRARVSPRMMTAGVILAVLALGAAGGAGANRYIQKSRPQPVLLLQPVPIAQLKERTPVAVKGQVAEVYGNKFIVQDDSGRTLVDTGPRGEGAPVPKGETVTVQGHFDNGFIHANVLTRADGTSQAFGPPPPHPKHGPGDGLGPRADRGFGQDRGPGPGRGPDAPPPPPN